MHKTRRAAETELELALDLQRRMPRVWDALDDGRIDLGRASVFARELESLHPALVPVAVDRVIDEAEVLTSGQLRVRLEKITVELDPEAAQVRHQKGLEDRRMLLDANPDHTASLLFHNVKAKEALLASRYVHGLAMKLKRQPGETRSLDQLRADIALDLLQGKTIHGAPPAPASIMVILQDTGGHIPGYGTVLPETVRDLLEDTQVEVNSGDCDHQTSSRRPSNAQTRHAARRYPTCVFPGCRIPATQCDLDHRHPWMHGGPTACHNLAPLCRHHHTCKPKWRLERDTDGSHIWTSPLGHTYRTSRPP